MGFNLESIMYAVGQLFMLPTLGIIGILFLYSFWLLGVFIMQLLQRKKSKSKFLLHFYLNNINATQDELDLFAHKLLQLPRIVSRVTPMLGLVATMIPMGPALKSLSDGNLASVSENLTVAFSAVILALITASITFFIANIKKSWLAEEMIEIEKLRGCQ